MTHPLSVDFRQQARSCLASSPLSATLLDAMADDLDGHGPTAGVMAAHVDDPGSSAPALRLLGALHRLVLERQAPGLAMHYPSVGGTAPVRAAWPAAREALFEHRERLTALVREPVQTNEVGRCALLYGGLLVTSQLTGLPVRLLEIGASAGLCLNVERFGYEVDSRILGTPQSPVTLRSPWRGYPPADLSQTLDIIDRAGCDPRPVDTATTEGRLTLTSYVWADWIERLDRLRHAMTVAAAHPPPVHREHGAAWLSRQLAWPRPGSVTVVWHSIVLQYVDLAERFDLEEVLRSAGARATATAPLAILGFENVAEPGGRGRFELSLRMWPGGRRMVLATAAPHGLPTTWA